MFRILIHIIKTIHSFNPTPLEFSNLQTPCSHKESIIVFIFTCLKLIMSFDMSKIHTLHVIVIRSVRRTKLGAIGNPKEALTLSLCRFINFFQLALSAT